MAVLRGTIEERKKRAEKFMQLGGTIAGFLDLMDEKTKKEEFTLCEVLKWTKWYCDEMAKVIDEGKKQIASYQFCFTPEVFIAMDMWPFCGEGLSAFMAILEPENLQRVFDHSEEMGWANHICSCLRGILAQEKEGILPPFDVLVNPSQPCDNNIITYQGLANLSKSPFFSVDIPYWNDERAIEYVTQELKRLISWLEEQTGKRLDLDRLREVVRVSNEANEYRLEVMEARRAIPCPQKSRSLAHLYMMMLSLSGTPQAIEFCKAIRNDAIDKVKKGIGALPREREKFRAITFYYPIWYEFRGGGLLDWMEQELGAVTVQDLEGYHCISNIEDTETYDGIMRGLAERVLSMPMGRQFRGPLTYYVDDIIRIKEDYSANVLVIPGHVGCKHIWGAMGLLKEMMREIDLPMCMFEVDIFDARVAPPDVLRDKISDFFALLN